MASLGVKFNCPVCKKEMEKEENFYKCKECKGKNTNMYYEMALL
jgi:Zn finger protein HypA/HybF involved in hydrogenase expression